MTRMTSNETSKYVFRLGLEKKYKGKHKCYQRAVNYDIGKNKCYERQICESSGKMLALISRCANIVSVRAFIIIAFLYRYVVHRVWWGKEPLWGKTPPLVFPTLYILYECNAAF